MTDTPTPLALPPPAPSTDSLLRVRDRLVAWTLRHRLREHPVIAALADLYDRRVAGDEPTATEWQAARRALALARALDRVALLGDRLAPVPSLDRCCDLPAQHGGGAGFLRDR